MKTADQITIAFKSELQALLDKWNAELKAADHYSGYPECGEDVRMTVSIPALWTEVGEEISERAEIDLGRLITPTEKNQKHTDL